MPLCHFIFQDVQHEESKNNPVHCPKRILSYHHNDYAAISDRGHAEYDFMTQVSFTITLRSLFYQKHTHRIPIPLNQVMRSYVTSLRFFRVTSEASLHYAFHCQS